MFCANCSLALRTINDFLYDTPQRSYTASLKDKYYGVILVIILYILRKWRPRTGAFTLGHFAQIPMCYSIWKHGVNPEADRSRGG
jgi:hypothetical protein